MNKKIKFAAFLAASLFIAGTVRADNDQCAQDCDAGKAKVGFADGDRATCVCMDPASGMDPTVVDTSVQSPGPLDAGASAPPPN